MKLAKEEIQSMAASLNEDKFKNNSNVNYKNLIDKFAPRIIFMEILLKSKGLNGFDVRTWSYKIFHDFDCFNFHEQDINKPDDVEESYHYMVKDIVKSYNIKEFSPKSEDFRKTKELVIQLKKLKRKLIRRNLLEIEFIPSETFHYIDLQIAKSNYKVYRWI